MPGLKLWFWTITSDTYPFKRMKTIWRMTEEDARARHGDDAVKVEGSLYITEPCPPLDGPLHTVSLITAASNEPSCC